MENKKFESVDNTVMHVPILESISVEDYLKMAEFDDMKNVSVIYGTATFFYDIDGISGFTNIDEILGFKKLFDLCIVYV